MARVDHNALAVRLSKTPSACPAIVPTVLGFVEHILPRYALNWRANAQKPKTVIHANERVLIAEFAEPSSDKRATVMFREAQ